LPMFAVTDVSMLALLGLGALLAGFTTGFSGFGTGLVASGIWFFVLPAEMVPPLIALASVTGQIAGIITTRKSFNWVDARPYLAGGIIGVPLGVLALSAISPFALRTFMGVLLIGYASFQLLRRIPEKVSTKDTGLIDGMIGMIGGFLGGFAGLSGPAPLIWLQLKGGSNDSQRAIYQPFNFIVLMLASLGMFASGEMTRSVMEIALICLPATLLGSFIGARCYIGVSAQSFQRIVLTLLLASGCILFVQSF